MEPGVFRAQPEDAAVICDHLLQAASVLGLVHLAQEDVQGAQGRFGVPGFRGQEAGAPAPLVR
jgi:hypothetical protein